MAKYGYLKCKCTDPRSDYIESHEILDVDETGFTIGLKRSSDFIGYKGSDNLPTVEQSVERMIERTKDYYDEWHNGVYPSWLNYVNDADRGYCITHEDRNGRVYVTLYTKERINVPLDYVKEHSNDNSNNGLYIKDFWSRNMTDTEKSFHGVLSDWTHNVYWGEEPTNCVIHTWPLD